MAHMHTIDCDYPRGAPCYLVGKPCFARCPDVARDARCTRIVGHEGPHRGYGHAMSDEEW